MKSLMWELSKRLVTEQRYLALKDSQKFQQRMGGSARQGGQYIQRLITTTYGFTSVMMLFFSFFLVSSSYGVSNELEHLQSISFILYSYIFLFSLYSVIMFINVIRTYRLFEPLRPLPSDIGHHILPVSWFIYNGSSSLFVIIPAVIEYYLYSGNFVSIPFGILWGFIVMALGYLAGVIVVSMLSGFKSQQKKGKLGVFSNIVRFTGLILIFILFEIALQEPGSLPALPTLHSQPLLLMIPLINIPYISFPTAAAGGSALPAGIITAFYGIVVYVLLLKFNRRIFLRISEQDQVSQSQDSGKPDRIMVSGFYRNSFVKDFRNIFRKPQNATMVIIPIIFVIPTLFQLFMYSSTVSYGTISVYYSLLSIVVVSASFYPIALIISEGNGISVLQALPLKLQDIIYSKSFVGTAIFTVIVVPISTLFLLKIYSGILELLLLPANLVLAYVYTSLFNIRWLMHKVPSGATTVNFYSFGGNIALFLLFAITLSLIALPTIIGTLLTFYVVFSPFSHPVSFYLSTLALNLAALFIIMNVVNRSS